MNNVVVLLIALLVGMALGAAIFAVVTHDPPRLKPPGLALEDGNSGQAMTELRARNQALEHELEQARAGAAQEHSPAAPAHARDRDTVAAAAPVQADDEPADAPAPIPEIPAGLTAEEALRRVLGRDPMREELEALEKWLQRRPPSRDEINARIAEGDAEGMLKMLATNRDARVMELLQDGERFGRMFERKSADVHVAHTELRSKGDRHGGYPDGMVIEFPPGVHRLDLSRHSPALRDVVIRGAGMDQTLLLAVDTLDARDALVRLHLENLTIDCSREGGGEMTLIDTRRNVPSTVRARNVRFVRFSSVISSRSIAFYASNCEFLAQFNRRGYSCLPFHSLGIAVFRVEDSLFHGPFNNAVYRVSEYQPGADEERYGQGEAFFLRCRFIDCLPDGDDDTVKMEGCTVTLNRPDDVRDWDKLSDYSKAQQLLRTYSRQEVRPLTDLNPAWRTD